MIFKLGLCQMKGSEDKIRSIETAEEMVKKAAYMGADIISLPEMFNCPYDNSNFRMYAENESGMTVKRLSKLASEEGIYLIGGSIPELDGGNVYNTCFCFDKNGNIAAKHRKIHLFNIDIEGGIRFMESETLTAGDKMTIFNTAYCDVGIAICFDVRFPELFKSPVALRSRSVRFRTCGGSAKLAARPLVRVVLPAARVASARHSLPRFTYACVLGVPRSAVLDAFTRLFGGLGPDRHTAGRAVFYSLKYH